MIQFPNEKALVYNKVIKALECEDYDVVYKCKKELMDSFNELSSTEIYVGLIKSLFYKEHYNDVIMVTEELWKKGYERYEIIFYVVFSSIALDDIYIGYSIVRKYNLLKEQEIKFIMSECGTYSSSMKYPMDITKCVISASFIEELVKEVTTGVDEQDGYLGLRVFEFINSLLELGCDMEIINELIDISNLIFIAYN